VLFRNGEPTLLSVLLQSGDTKGVAQANDAIANLASVAGVAGKVGRRPGPDLHSIVRVEPTDDLTICITPSAGKRNSSQPDTLYCFEHTFVRLPVASELSAHSN